MKTRTILAAVGVLLLMVAIASCVATKDATVTLEISGMTWGSCASTVQSALEAVKGVKEVNVSLEKKEAVVKYAADVVKVADLIEAVKSARGMNSYDVKSARGMKWSAPFRRAVNVSEAPALVNNGAISPQLFNDTNGEHIGVFTKLEPLLGETRAIYGPQFAVNFEKLIDATPDGRKRTTEARERIKAIRAQLSTRQAAAA